MRSSTSSNPEVNQQSDQNIDRPTVQATGLEPPLTGSSDGLLVEPVGIQRPHHADVGRTAIGADDELESDGPLNVSHERVGRVGRLDLAYHARRSHAAARQIHSSANASS